MFVYFDRNGTLKEIITEQPFRNGDSERDKIYVYLEDETLPYNGWIKYLLPDGTTTEPETQFFSAVDGSKVGKELPLNPPRNLKFFNYEHTYIKDGVVHTGYLFYEITVPDEVLNSATTEDNMVIARIRFINGNNIFTLGSIVFSVESNIGILTDNSINETQYNYLLKRISTLGDVSQLVDLTYLVDHYYDKTQANNLFALISQSGYKIVLNINNTNFKISASLYDKNDNLITTSNEIDLPLESAVVSGYYDNATKKLILTLQSGGTIEVPVGSLISGLQTEINAQNKLNADYVDDTNSIHKFVSASQISKINSAQVVENLTQSIRDKTVASQTLYTSEKAVATFVDGFIIPNPTETPDVQMNKIKIKNTVYSLGGGGGSSGNNIYATLTINTDGTISNFTSIEGIDWNYANVYNAFSNVILIAKAGATSIYGNVYNVAFRFVSGTEEETTSSGGYTYYRLYLNFEVSYDVSTTSGTIRTCRDEIYVEMQKGVSTVLYKEFSRTINANVDDTHTHSNKAVLDGITSANIQNWNGKLNAYYLKSYNADNNNGLLTGLYTENDGDEANLVGFRRYDAKFRIGDEEFGETFVETTIVGHTIKFELATDTYDLEDLIYKQDELVSGQNIKTINGQSILGSGDISGSVTTYNLTNGVATGTIENGHIYAISIEGDNDKLFYGWQLVYFNGNDVSIPIVDYNYNVIDLQIYLNNNTTIEVYVYSPQTGDDISSNYVGEMDRLKLKRIL